MVTVKLTAEATGQLEGLPLVVKQRLREVVTRLQSWPTISGVKSLTGTLAGRYRARTGDYRVQFTVKTVRTETKIEKRVKGKRKVETVVRLDYIVTVEKVGHRDGFYDER
jgi:mRNA-degrading endonuclease RelE of RelBE toxin-antitoxin system